MLSFHPQNTKSNEKNPDGPSENNDFNCTYMTGTALVSRVAKVIKAIIISDFLEIRSFEKSIRSGLSNSTN